MMGGKPKIYSGTSIAAGKGLGQAVIVEVKNDNIIRRITRDEILLETDRFENAKLQATKYYDDLSKVLRAKAGTGSDDASIIEIYKCIVNDPMLSRSVMYNIRTELFSAESSVQKVANDMMEEFKSIEDEYIRERDKDICEAGKRILHYLGCDNFEERIFEKDVVLFINGPLILSHIVGKNIEKIKGVVCLASGKTSHAAIVARSNSIPVISDVDLLKLNLVEGNNVLIDCDVGTFTINPTKKSINEYNSYINEKNLRKRGLPAFLKRPVFTNDGMSISVMANVSIEDDARLAVENGADGIGLVRTEILFTEYAEFPSESEQIRYYEGIFNKIGSGKKVNIRVMDVGGDKMVKFINDIPREENPFMGWRAVRIYRERTEFLHKQLVAILKAGEGKKYGIMFPMITTLSEWDFLRNFTIKTADELGIKCPSLGVLLEVPLAILEIESFLSTLEFASIGTNDLMQYLSAADRSNAKVNYLYNPLEPAFLKIVKTAIDQCVSGGKPISMCGDMAARPECTILLLGLGLTRFSVSPPTIPIIKEIISCIPLMKIKEETNHLLLNKRSAKDVADWLQYINGKYCAHIFKKHGFIPLYGDYYDKGNF
ncbi:MAG: phosphoenolpyruvate--protein phosphotransferase [Chitinivibrionia bacterium]|nr:phosphoenolpyruvate--protein phosphotransferase [Chitinivibrionia bacterium]